MKYDQHEIHITLLFNPTNTTMYCRKRTITFFHKPCLENKEESDEIYFRKQLVYNCSFFFFSK